MSWIHVGRSTDFPEGQGKTIIYGRKSFAIFRVQRRLYVIDNRCPHEGGPLAQGYLMGFQVLCPLHAWDFDVRTGQSIDISGASVGAYSVKEQDDVVYLDVPDATLEYDNSLK